MSAPVCCRIIIIKTAALKCAHPLFILFTIISAVNVTAGLRLTNMSAPVVADLRGDLNLDCHFDMGAEELYAVKWYKDDHEFFRYLPHHQPPEMTFPVAGVHMVPRETICNQSRCKIRLTRLTRVHSSGAYRCEVSSEAPAFRLASETHNVTVAALPEGNPRIEGLADSYHLGDVLTATCTSSEADPTPFLTWHINENQAPPNLVGDWVSSPSSSSEKDAGGLTSSRSVSLRFQVERKYTQGNFIQLRCVSSLPGIPISPQTVSRMVIVRTRAAAAAAAAPPQVNNEKLYWPNVSNKPKPEINFFVLTIVFARWLFKVSSS